MATTFPMHLHHIRDFLLRLQWTCYPELPLFCPFTLKLSMHQLAESPKLTPYQGVWYYLAEWGCAHLRFLFYFYPLINLLIRPAKKEELFNLCHAQLHNVIECIFGVIKWKFWILLLPVEYNLEMQARIPAVICAIHNFTRDHEPNIREPGADSEEAVVMRDRVAEHI